MKYVLLIIAFIAGWFVGRGLPQNAPEPEIVYVNRDAPDYVGPMVRMGNIIAEPLQPTQIFRYRILPIEKLRVDTVFVPKDFNIAGVIDRNPIAFNRSNIILTYFDPDSLRFQQIRYQLPQRDFSLSLQAHSFTNLQLFDPHVGIRLNAHYRRLTIGTGAYLSFQRPPSYLLHISYDIL